MSVNTAVMWTINNNNDECDAEKWRQKQTAVSNNCWYGGPSNVFLL